MRSNTERKWLAPVLCAAGAILYLAAVLVLMCCGLLDLGTEDGLSIAVLLLFGAVLLAMIAGVGAALVQRLRELKRGEEEDAGKY